MTQSRIKSISFRQLLIWSLACLASLSLNAQEINVISWNLESGDSDVNVIANRIESMQGIDIWGLSEVQNQSWIDPLEAAAEAGENTEFQSILGTTGGGDKLLIIYDSNRFELISKAELHNINIEGNVRSPLVAHFKEIETEQEFLFMVNHLYRTNNMARHQQSRLLNEWGEAQDIPIIAVGDYNYDWEVEDGENDHDEGYDLLTAAGIFTWVRPSILIPTQCSFNSRTGNCKHNSVIDFVFVANMPVTWNSESEIIKAPGDFPDDNSTPDHRPLLGSFNINSEHPDSCNTLKERILIRIGQLETELEGLKTLVNQF